MSKSRQHLDLTRVSNVYYWKVTKIIRLQTKLNGGCQMPEVEIGKVSDFFKKPVVVGVELTASLRMGDKVRIKGHTTNMELIIQSMQIDNSIVTEAKAGDSIGIKVGDRARRGDTVYKVTP